MQGFSSANDDGELPRDLNVLLVEPQRFLCGIMRGALISAGVDTDNITEARSATKALDMLKTRAFDVVLTELDLPDTDGEYVVRKAREWGIVIPIMAVTAEATEHKLRVAVNAGISDFLVKPVSQMMVSKRIARQLLSPGLPDPERRRGNNLSGFSLATA